MSTPLLQQFPSLSGYPTSFLKDLLSSPQLVEAYLFTLPQIQELAAEVERLSKENEDLAKGNMALRDELFALRDATAQSYAHAEALKAQWAEIEKAQASYYQKQRPSFLHLRLRHSITAQDDSSEKVANAFIEGRPLNGPSTPSMRTDSPTPGSESAGFSASSYSGGQGANRSVEEFISEFKASRKTYHKRAIWAERWSRGEVAWRDD